MSSEKNSPSNTCFNCSVADSEEGHHGLKNRPVAYFCAEYGIEDNLPLYAGGLGILSGDFVKTAGEKGVPLVAIGIFYKKGFATYDPGKESIEINLDPKDFGFSILKDSKNETLIVDVEVDSTIFYARVWTKSYGSAKLFLFDTDFEKNKEKDREISSHLYDGRFDVKVLQEVLIGIGGIKLLRDLGINPSIYHLNEGHTSFAALALCVEYLHDHPNETSIKNALTAVRPKIVSTKHTILSASGTHFSKNDFLGIVDSYLSRHGADFNEFFSLGLDSSHGEDLFSATKFLISSSVRTNAVSMLHAVFEKREHPYGDLISVTNGINRSRWISSLWPEDGIASLSDEDIWKIHSENRKKLVAFLNSETGANLNPDALTIVWARRFAAYKRPELILSNIQRLEKMLNSNDYPVQLVISGRASKNDEEGINLIKRIVDLAKGDKFKNKIIYLPEYSVISAKKLITGADLWLSTPIRGKEACGTSSMKSGINGVLQFSTSDGWLEEVDWSDKGWILPDSSSEDALFNILENKIIPEFFDRDGDTPKSWVKKMRNTIGAVEKGYTTERMLDSYLKKLYFPCQGV